MTRRVPVIVRPLARRDVRDAAVWYEERSARFVAAADAAFAAAGADPERYPQVLRDVRRIRVSDFPYAVYFVVRGGILHVLAVIHGRRHPRRWQARARGV